MSGFNWKGKGGSDNVLSFLNDGTESRGSNTEQGFPYLKYNLPNILNPLRLHLPGDDDIPSTHKAPSPEDIKAWLDGLSADAYRSTGRETQGLLRGLNLHHILARRHLKALILLQPHVSAVVAHLRSKYHNYPLPFDDKIADLAALSCMLLEEMAIGYKLIVNDVICDLAEKNLDHNMFLFALQQAIVQIGQQLLEYYIQYRREPEHLWGELHRLYQFAERNGFNTVPIETLDPESEAPPSTIQRTYMHVVLLGLTQPNHLFSGQAEMIYEYLARWIDSVKMGERMGTLAETGDMLVDLASEQAPIVATGHTRFRPIEGRYLDISRLDAKLEKLRNKIGPENDDTLPLTERIQRDMLTRLCDAWQGRGERRSERIMDGKTPVLTSIGLEAGHHLISGEKSFEPEKQELEGQAARKKDINKTIYTNSTLAESWDTLRTVSHEEADQENSSNAFISQDDAWQTYLHSKIRLRDQEQKAPHYPVEAWRRINHSHGGMALRRQANKRIQMYVGSLVVFRDDKDNQAWRIGVIRWLQNSGSEDFNAGIEALADQSRAVAVHAVNAQQGDTQYFRALLIKPLNSTDIQQAIILPSSIFEPHDNLALNENGQMYSIELREIIKATSSFSIFRFEQPL